MEAYSQQEDRKVQVTIEGLDFTCQGVVHLPGIRLSDVMNEKNQFLVVVDATLFPKGNGNAGAAGTGYETLLINKNEIKYVVPLDDRRLSRFCTRSDLNRSL
jgi:hypothetical protein